MNKKHKKTKKKFVKTTKYAIIYARVSSAEQVSGYSLDSQVESNKDFAIKNGFIVDKTFIEKGESAKTIDRTELRNLMKYCAENKHLIDAIIVWKLDRLSRNMPDFYALDTFFNKLDIKILSATENNDDTSTGKLTRNILGAMAQFENDQKSERVIAGMKQGVNSGKWLWKAPLGYKQVKGNLVVDEDKAKIIRKIFTLFATGLYSQQQIRKELEKENIHITSTRMFYILRACIYCGRIKSHLLEDDNYIIGDFEPIISEELFDKVQAILNNDEIATSVYSRNNPEFPLRQFIRCPFCGNPLTASKSSNQKRKKYAYYHCYNKDCKTQVRIPKEELEKQFYRYLSEMKPTEPYLKEFKSYLKESYTNAVKDIKLKSMRLNKELNDISDKKNKILDMYVDAKLSESDYKLKSAQYEEKINYLKILLADCKLPDDNFDKCVDYVCKALEQIEKVWYESDLDTKQRIQQLIFPNGLIYENNAFRTALNPCENNNKGALLAPFLKLVPPSEFESLSTP